jgi:hypothetical protein
MTWRSPINRASRRRTRSPNDTPDVSTSRPTQGWARAQPEAPTSGPEGLGTLLETRGRVQTGMLGADAQIASAVTALCGAGPGAERAEKRKRSTGPRRSPNDPLL